MDKISKALIVEDDMIVQGLLQTCLGAEGFDTLTAIDGAPALEIARLQKPELVTLDIVLPVYDGFWFILRLREISNAPVVAITCKGDDETRQKMFALGVDDYLVKPFKVGEFKARVRALMHRAYETPLNPNIFRHGGLEVDFKASRVKIDGQEVHLTDHELKLLELLVKHPGQVVTFEEFLKKVWFPGCRERHYVQVAVSNPKHALGRHGARIVNIHGVGYRFAR